MKLMVGNEDLASRILKNIGDGKVILFKYGPGSGGDRLMHEFFQSLPGGHHSIMISTHETKKELDEIFKDLEIEGGPDRISLLPMMDETLSRIQKKDGFIKDGIMVTDLLEISSYSEERARARSADQLILSTLTTTATSQVLPFWLVLDSLVDVVNITGLEEAFHRLMILKRTIKEKNGIALIGCPIDCDLLWDHETTFFDAVIEVFAESKGEVWVRKLRISNVKGSGAPPEEWEINVVKDIPTAISMD